VDIGARKKDSENIYSQEVERAIAKHPDVRGRDRRCRQMGRDGRGYRRAPRRRPADDRSDRCAWRHADRQLQEAAPPRLVDALPLLENGKVDKIGLRKQIAKAANEKQGEAS
jgi:hypothetical protein